MKKDIHVIVLACLAPEKLDGGSQNVISFLMRLFVIPAVLAILLFSCSKSIPYQNLPFDGNSVRINLSGLREDQPEFYSVSVDGKEVSFFIVMKNGKIQSYFDACRRCYTRKVGFGSDGGYMRCRACNSKYPMNELKEGIGDCSPVILRGVEKKDTYVITKESLLKGMRFF